MGQIESEFRILDASLILDDGLNGAKTASFSGFVAGAAKILSLGTARVRGEMVIDISALDATTGDESYKVVLQGGTEALMSSGSEEELAVVTVGGAAAKVGDVADAAPVRLTVPFDTHRAGVIYPYARIQVLVAGTSPSITLGESFLSRSA